MDDFTYTCSFEELGRWSNSPLVTREMSRTGQYATYTDSTHEFSQTFYIARGDLKNNHAQTIQVSAWALSKSSGANAVLVISVERNNKNIGRAEAATGPLLNTAMKWQEISCNLKLAEPVEEGTTIKVYGWKKSNDPVYWDDFSIQIY